MNKSLFLNLEEALAAARDAVADFTGESEIVRSISIVAVDLPDGSQTIGFSPLPARLRTSAEKWQQASHEIRIRNFDRGLRLIKELLRDDEPIPAEGKALLYELLDGRAFDIKLVCKKTNGKSKCEQRWKKHYEMKWEVEQTMKAGLNKTAALKEVAPDSERQAARSLAKVKNRRFPI
jgi:hypothetical protein